MSNRKNKKKMIDEESKPHRTGNLPKGSEEPQMYVPDRELHLLGSEWEQFLLNRLREAGLNVIATGKGVAGSNFQGEGPSPPDFKVEGKKSIYIELSGSQKLTDYRNLLIQTGKLRYVRQYQDLVFVFYRGRVKQWGSGAQLYWIKGEVCLGYRSEHIEQDVDKARAQATFVPKDMWTLGLDTLIEYLRSLGEAELMLFTDLDELLIIEHLTRQSGGPAFK